MSTLRALAPAKVNLGLFVDGIRDDGRHALVTVFEAVSLADEVRLWTRLEAAGSGGSESGAVDEVICPGVRGRNIVAAALAGLRARGWCAPPVTIEIDKRIPVAGGMGGGSADAGAALRLAQRVAPLAPAALHALAGELGADVPSQLEPGLAIGSGAGDIVEPVAPLAPHAFVIVPAPAHLSTAEVYKRADRLGGLRYGAGLAEAEQRLRAALRGGGVVPAELLVNDLQRAAVSLNPAIEPALAALLNAGAEHAFLCGSGPTVAGLLWGEDARLRADAIAASVRERFPAALSAVPVDAGFGTPALA